MDGFDFKKLNHEVDDLLSDVSKLQAPMGSQPKARPMRRNYRMRASKAQMMSTSTIRNSTAKNREMRMRHRMRRWFSGR